MSRKSRSRKPKYKSRTYRDITEFRNRFVDQLKAEAAQIDDPELSVSSRAAEAARTLDIWHSMKINVDGEPRTSLSQQIEVLGCRRWQMMLNCANTGQSVREHIKVCRRRFLCMNCHTWKLQSQAERWNVGIRQILRRNSLCIGPAVQLTWSTPGTDKRKLLAQFDNFINKTFTLWLSDQHIGTDQCFLFRTMDPIKSEIRLLYIGPPITTDLWLRTYIYISDKSVVIENDAISHKSVVIPSHKGQRGYTSPWWQADTLAPIYLLNPKDPKIGDADQFDRYLRESLYWCVGDAADLIPLKREQVWRLYEQYNKTRLFSSRGLLYQGDSDWRTLKADLPAESDPSLIVEKLHRDGSTELFVTDPIRLLGAENCDADGAAKGPLCPMCGDNIDSAAHQMAEKICEKQEAGLRDADRESKRKGRDRLQ
jgi:hypothetical protein